MAKTAFITGVTGQDGSFLAEYLIDLGYDVWGMIRRASNSAAIDFITENTKGRVKMRYGDMEDVASIRRILKECKPDEIYNLAAQSHVRASFDIPEQTSRINGTGVLNILEAMRCICPGSRFYQASTSEMFGSTPPPQNEDTMMHPRSPYGVAKLHGFWSVINARESYGSFACNGILFNHESERRGVNFVTRKITRMVARIALGLETHIDLGNLDAKRDWGYAKDYIEAMYLMLQQDKPDDFVVATGEAHSVRSFVEAAFSHVGIDIESNGKAGFDEIYYRVDTGDPVVMIDPRFYRPAEVDYLCGDASKARKVLGWSSKTSLDELVRIMVRNDLEKESKRLC